MPISRAEVQRSLSGHPADRLADALSQADLAYDSAASPSQLAEQLATALWWHYSTPLGYALDRGTLDDIVQHVAHRCRLTLAAGDAWTRARDLAEQLAPGAASPHLHHLDPAHQRRLRGSWLPTSALGTGAAGAYGARQAGKTVLRWTSGPIGRIAPYVPYVGPWFKTARGGATVAAAVGGPAAVALGALALNDALGTRYDRLLPLLIAVGRLGPGIYEAEET